VRRRIREALHELGTRGKERDVELHDALEKLRTEQAELSLKVKRLESLLPLGTEPKKSAGAEPKKRPRKGSSAQGR
jgi:hypothetical protein